MLHGRACVRVEDFLYEWQDQIGHYEDFNRE